MVYGDVMPVKLTTPFVSLVQVVVPLAAVPPPVQLAAPSPTTVAPEMGAPEAMSVTTVRTTVEPAAGYSVIAAGVHAVPPIIAVTVPVVTAVTAAAVNVASAWLVVFVVVMPVVAHMIVSEASVPYGMAFPLLS
jgi:hypothetical protein